MNHHVELTVRSLASQTIDAWVFKDEHKMWRLLGELRQVDGDYARFVYESLKELDAILLQH